MKYNSRAWFRLGQSGAIFGIAAPELREMYPLKILSSDMSEPAGLGRYKSLFPDDFYNVGIAEQNLIGISAGLVSEGYKVVAEAQAAFITMRSFEQIRQYMGYMQFPIITVGINAGFALTYFGNTHYAIEDLGLMRQIPGMIVLSPADAGEAVKCFEAALTINHPVYIRLTGGLQNPIVYRDDFEYAIGKLNCVYSKGNDVSVFATGSMVYQSIEAANILSKSGIGVRVIDVHTLKPLNSRQVASYADCRLMVTVEEHSTIGGLSSAIGEALIELCMSHKLLKIGVKDCFSKVGDYEFLLKEHGLTAPQIADSILRTLSSEEITR